ncbi:replication initiation protein RepC [Pseudoxanthobacter soli DSM 19599]|uniref:Replication initiation protein RepC n=1 Tax=Pseudoxanthobacter soli DSM 19599 TaxID=1123029 RepID=A0A1M7ZQR3_9HYPH|nr:replication initiation protein RepC [Pseudoxanthobacter soli DSM 19599]
MVQSIVSTPFGRRSLTFASIAAQRAVAARPAKPLVHKWKLYRAIAEAKPVLGISDRALSVLSALLSCHADMELDADADLVVFPSNRELSLRAHGMAAATLRRHLAALVAAGLVIRRDSPNGKRYARKGEHGEIEVAYGFDLRPLLARADEFERLVERLRAERRQCAALRERISLHRRDIAKARDLAREEDLVDFPLLPGGKESALDRSLRGLDLATLRAVEAELDEMRANILKALQSHEKLEKSSACDSQNERHIQTQDPDSIFDEARDEKDGSAEGEAASCRTQASRQQDNGPKRAAEQTPIPLSSLSLTLAACPTVRDYARHGIASWSDLIDTADRVRVALSISQDAWTEALAVMGRERTAVSIALLLEQVDRIRSPGGYLRRLTEQARRGGYRPEASLMVLLKRRENHQPRTPERPAAMPAPRAEEPGRKPPSPPAFSPRWPDRPPTRAGYDGCRGG